MRVKGLESKSSAVADAEAQNRERNNELAGRLAGEETLRSRATDVGARVVALMNSLSTTVFLFGWTK